jgi:hypothetical protein
MRHAHARRIGKLASTLLASASVALASMAGAAQATPTEVDVRIEGRTQTLFEGPILSEGHNVSSYKGAGGEEAEDLAEHPCDGINALDPGNAEPGPVPTAASVDAMNAIGETKAMAGQWYNGFEDYFVKQWGAEEENAESEGRSWGILVNNVFTSVGGCQYQLDTGDEVLWAYNAFEARPFLALFAADAGYAGGDRPLTATAQLGKPFQLEVLAYEDDTEDIPPAHPQRVGATAFVGAEVTPVTSTKKGVEQLDLESPETVSTNSAGKASITFTTPGWHRLKAGGPIDAETEEEEVIRSNRLDVCVPPEGAGSCGEPPAEDRLRVPPRYQAQIGSAPKNWKAPDIHGFALAGHALAATEGDWTGKATIAYSYRWQLCGKPGGDCEDIPGATSPSYEIPSSTAGHTLRVIVNAKNGVGSAEAESLATNEVPALPSNPEPPSIEGTAEAGHSSTTPSGEGGGGGGGTSTGKASAGLTPAGQVLGQTATAPAAKVAATRLSAGQLTLKVSAACLVVVKIARRRRHAGKLAWSALKTIEIRASKAGTITVHLPRLSPGSYRLSIALADSKALLRVLTVKRR